MLLTTENTDISVIVQSLSLLIPARSFNVDLDFTSKTTVPAILETAINLISCLDLLSTLELQQFFGLDDNEREILIEQIELSGFALINGDGLLTSTQRLRDLRLSTPGKLLMDEVENHYGKFVVDLLTHFIQPPANDAPIRGLKLLTDLENDSNIDPNKVLLEQFPRFQDCSKRQVLQSGATKLYRVNRCEYDRLTSIPLSIDLYIRPDPLGQLHIESELFGFSVINEQLISSSGLLLKVGEYLNSRRAPRENLAINNYCALMNDEVLSQYVHDDVIDLDSLLVDMLQNKLSKEDSLTEMMVGPIYLENNKKVILDWLSNYSSHADLSYPPLLWRPSHDDLWGSSVRLKTFTQEVDELLAKHKSQLVLLLPNVERSDEREYRNKFQNLISNAYLLSDAPPLDNLEVMIFDGDSSFAVVQYHVWLEPKWGLGGFTLPIGYVTKDPKYIDSISTFIRKQATTRTEFKPIISAEVAFKDELFEKVTGFFSKKSG